MRGELAKAAVQQIEKHAHYATTGSACREAMRQDTPEAYLSALKQIVTSPNRGGEYGVNIDAAEHALRNDR